MHVLKRKVSFSGLKFSDFAPCCAEMGLNSGRGRVLCRTEAANLSFIAACFGRIDGTVRERQRQRRRERQRQRQRQRRCRGSIGILREISHLLRDVSVWWGSQGGRGHQSFDARSYPIRPGENRSPARAQVGGFRRVGRTASCSGALTEQLSPDPPQSDVSCPKSVECCNGRPGRTPRGTGARETGPRTENGSTRKGRVHGITLPTGVHGGRMSILGRVLEGAATVHREKKEKLTNYVRFVKIGPPRAVLDARAERRRQLHV